MQGVCKVVATRMHEMPRRALQEKKYRSSTVTLMLMVALLGGLPTEP